MPFNKTKSPLLLPVLFLNLACIATAFSAPVTLDTVLVSHDRDQQPLRDIAASAFLVDGEHLQTVNHVHVNEAVTQVPGVWISRGNGQEHLTAIRSPVLTGAGSCGAFQMSLDGIPLRAAGFCNVNQLFEVNTEQAAAIEVISGPGSVLYGSNALHGAINVLSPSVSNNLWGTVALDVGPHGYQRIKTGVSNTQGRHGVRLNVNGARDGGFKDDSGFDQQKLDLKHQYFGDKYKVTSLITRSNLNQQTAGYVLGERAYEDDDLKTVNPNPEAFRNAKSTRLQSQISWQDGLGQWTISPYYRNTKMDFLMHFLPGTPLEENAQQSLGVQSMFKNIGNAGLEYRLGVDAEISNGELRQTQAQVLDHPSAFLSATLPQGKQYDYKVQVNMLSPFAMLTLHASPTDQFSLGLRAEYLHFDYQNKMLDGRSKDDGTACDMGGCRYSRPGDRSDSYNNTSTQLGWIHNFDEYSQTFINLSHAFRAPQASELYRLQNSQLVADLNSEQIDSFELGFRGNFKRGNISAALFFMNKDNVIFQNSDRENVSDGKTQHKGLELHGNLVMTPSLGLKVAASYALHTYEENIAPRGVSENIDGNQIDTAPKVTGSAQLNWQVSNNKNMELEWIHMGPYYTDEANLHSYEGHELVNLRFMMEMGNWHLGARVNNLLDTDYAERADYAFGNDRYFVGEPRSVYLSVASEF